MSLEEALRNTLESTENLNGTFKKQITDFREFEQRMTDAGYHIEREKFSIPLMDRVSTSYLYQ